MRQPVITTGPLHEEAGMQGEVVWPEGLSEEADEYT